MFFITYWTRLHDTVKRYATTPKKYETTQTGTQFDCIIFILLLDFACGTGGFITSWLKELAPQVKNTIDRQLFSHSIHGVEKKQFPYMLAVTNMLLHDIDEPDILHGNSLTRKVLDYTDEDKFDKILMTNFSGYKYCNRSHQTSGCCCSQYQIRKAC